MKREFSRDFGRALDDVADDLADRAVKKSRDVISVEERVFKGEVLKRFRIATTRDGQFEQSRLVYNTSDHADAVDRGVPASAYADGGPPVQALLPWVKAKMGGWSLDWSEDGGGGGNDGDDTTTVTIISDKGNPVNAEVEESWNLYDRNIPPRPDQIYLGQRMTVVDALTEERYSGTVISQNHLQATIKRDDTGQEFTLRLDSNLADDVIVGAEDPLDLSKRELAEKAGAYIAQVDSPDFDDGRKADIATTLETQFYSQFRDKSDILEISTKLTQLYEINEDGVGGRASPANSYSSYRMGFNSNHLSDSTRNHENTHGFHFMNKVKDGYYAPFPTAREDADGNRQPPEYTYPNFLFDKDGTSRTDFDPSDNVGSQKQREENGTPDMQDIFFVNDETGEVYGEDKIPDIYNLVYGDNDYTADFDGGLDFAELLKPENDFISEGDAIRYEFPDGDGGMMEKKAIIRSEVKTSHFGGSVSYYYEVEEFKSGNNAELHFNEDGTPDNPDTEITGAAQNVADTELPINKNLSDKEQLWEATNLAWAVQAFSISKRTEELGKRPSTNQKLVPNTFRDYSTRAPSETLTTLTEILLSDASRKLVNLESINDDFPGLIEAWSNVLEPSEAAKDKLDELGIDY